MQALHNLFLLSARLNSCSRPNFVTAWSSIGHHLAEENKWAWADKALRKAEASTDSFSTFKRRCVQVCNKYPAENLLATFAGRLAKCLALKGINIGK